MPRGADPPSRRNELERYKQTWNEVHKGSMMAHAWKRKMLGWSAHQIAAELGCSVGTVRQLWRDFQAQNPTLELEQHRQLELDRLNAQRQRLEALLDMSMRRAEIVITDDGFTAVAHVDIDQARKLVMDLAKLGERESKFLGLDAPEKREVEVTVQNEEERKFKALFDRIEKEQR